MPIIKEVAPYTDANGNTIVGAPANAGTSTINFGAKNCTVTFGKGVTFHGGIHFQQDGGSVTIGAGSIVRASIGVGENCQVVFGAKTACSGPIDVVAYDGSDITVGEDCLFAAGVQLRGWDQHPIYDLRTGKRSNYGRSVTIGSRVWMAKDAVALPGSVVGDGSIVGMRSMVAANSPVPPHCVAVGTPARVVKRYAAWAKGPAHPELANFDSYPAPESMPYFEERTPSTSVRIARKLHRITSSLVSFAESRS